MHVLAGLAKEERTRCDFIEVVVGMRLLVIKRTILVLIALLIIALFLLSISYSFSPVAETFKNSIDYKQVERQVLKKYKAMDGKLEYSLPQDWTAMEEPFGGGEIIYNQYFLSKDKKIHGFVQVWDMKKPLKQFLDESKKSAVGVVDFKYYRVKDITVDTNRGYLLDYSRKTNKDIYVRSYEAFLEGPNNRIYRISFFVEEQNWKPQYLILFNRIIRSFVIMK